MPGTILVGDCREQLATLPAQSVHCVVTSPPYWGLRDYNLPPSIWGGDPGCEHEWEGIITPAADGTLSPEGNAALRAGHQGANSATMKPRRSDLCGKCGAWRGCLGLEPTPEAFVANMVAVFREVWRVLRDDGCAFLNLGDSFSSGGRTGHGTRVGYKQQTNRGMCGENNPPRPPGTPGRPLPEVRYKSDPRRLPIRSSLETNSVSQRAGDGCNC